VKRLEGPPHGAGSETSRTGDPLGGVALAKVFTVFQELPRGSQSASPATLTSHALQPQKKMAHPA
jgi:hypothetical protein